MHKSTFILRMMSGERGWGSSTALFIKPSTTQARSATADLVTEPLDAQTPSIELSETDLSAVQLPAAQLSAPQPSSTQPTAPQHSATQLASPSAGASAELPRLSAQSSVTLSSPESTFDADIACGQLSYDNGGGKQGTQISGEDHLESGTISGEGYLEGTPSQETQPAADPLTAMQLRQEQHHGALRGNELHSVHSRAPYR